MITAYPKPLSQFSDIEAEHYLIDTATLPGGWEIVGKLGIMAAEFSCDTCRKVFSACERLADTGAEIHALTVADEAQLNHDWKVRLIQDPQFSASEAITRYHRDNLREKYLIRRKRELCQLGESEDMPVEELIQRLCDLSTTSRSGEGPRFTDLRAIMGGDIAQESPTVAEIWPGRALFYAGRLNEIHAEPSVGKTNILLAAAIQVIHLGGCVLYLDPEDTPRGFVSRLLALGGDPEDIAERVRYLHNPDPTDIQSAIAWAKSNPVEMVVLDGCAEMMAAVGADENSASEVLSFFRSYLRPFAEAGAAVVVADHVSKSTEGRGRWARGSGAKLGRYDGVVYEIVPGQAYTPTQAGNVSLKISKDRNGGAGAMGQTVAEIHFEPGHKGTIVTFREPQGGGAFRPTKIIDRILERLAEGEQSKRELRSCGKAEYVDIAVRTLVDEGQITEKREGQKVVFSLEKACPKPRDTVAGGEA